ncbi:MAG: rRNA pseudouridine synthase [Deltaproteobacteria bacterium]|nr:rRNA pseudouridine synthase [Deltaproteobacteria bacterium]
MTTDHTPPETEGIRLHKAMAKAGLASLREAERWIADGRVTINSRTAGPGDLVHPGLDQVSVDGRPVSLAAPANQETWALYKPKGVVSTLSDPQGRPSLRDYLPKTKTRLFPVGRLDYDAEGLILMTSDGALAQRAAHPAHGMAKIYLVKVKGLVDPPALARHAKAPVIEGVRHRPAKARVLHTVNDKTWVELTLREGMKHHVKKFFLAMGHRVLKLKRWQVGPVILGDLNPGESRRLTRDEVAELLGNKKPGARKEKHLKLMAKTWMTPD